MSRYDYNRDNKVLILGNGFDVDLGMRSRYSDFAKSKIWKERIESNAFMLSRNGLLRAMVNAKEKNDWFDIESTMMVYVRKLQKTGPTYGFTQAGEDEEEYHLICSCLKDYLREESQKFRPNRDNAAERVFEALINGGRFKKIYTFNYTDVKEITQYYEDNSRLEVIHMHGSLESDDDIILGVEGGDIIPQQYKFMYKTSSRFYQSNNLYEDLMHANEVVFFGHSINGMDFDYFSHFFRVQSDDEINGYERKWIRIFTYDNNSAMDIKYSLRENGILPHSLYNLNDLDFILCKDLEKGDKRERAKYDKFVSDISKLGRSNIEPSIYGK